ncbi:MAG: GTPase domain-containing protein [Gemmataceae bacterium]|nr:GTPase domain-containing protein [Gemmataceae bacterium]
MSADTVEVAPQAEPMLRTLAPALRTLESRIRGWLAQRLMPPFTTLQRATFEGLADDLRRQADALQQEQPLLTIVLMGGTGVGKSSLLNALAGGAIAQASFARPTTRDPVVYFHESISPHQLDPALRICKLAVHDRPALRSKVLVDTPDVDSNDLGNREKLFAILPAADIVLYVGSQEKYHDQLGWNLFKEQRKRHAFAFVLNKWDRCQHPGAGTRPDEDWIRDLKAEGFEHPLLFRTMAQHWIDHPWQDNPNPTKPDTTGEQFLDLTRWLERGLKKLEIEAIKVRGVGQLLAEIQTGLTTATPPDLIAVSEKTTRQWRRLLDEESRESADVLLRAIDPHEAEVEKHFAVQRQEQFGGIMGAWLRLWHKLRYGGFSLPRISMLPKAPSSSAAASSDFDLIDVARRAIREAADRSLESRFKAFGNRLLISAESEGMPVLLLGDRVDAVSRLDWRTEHARAMIEVLAEAEKTWAEPTGVRRVVHRSLQFLANVLPMTALVGMGGKLIWDWTMGTQPSSITTSLLLPFATVFMVLLILHVAINIFLPLRWPGIRAEYERRMTRRLEADLGREYLPLPGKLADDLLDERKRVEDLRKEVSEVARWLQEREEAASVADLYGN